MKPSPQNVLSLAMQLSEKERAELAGDLIASLDAEAEEGRQAAWEEEIARRVREVDEGTAKLIPWETVRDEVRGIVRGQ